MIKWWRHRGMERELRAVLWTLKTVAVVKSSRGEFPVHLRKKLFTKLSFLALFPRTSDFSSPFHRQCTRCTAQRKWFTSWKAVASSLFHIQPRKNWGWLSSTPFIFSHRHDGRNSFRNSLPENLSLSDFCHVAIHHNRTNKCAFKSCDVSAVAKRATFATYREWDNTRGIFLYCSRIEIDFPSGIFVLCAWD